MARLIRTDTKVNMSCSILTYLADGSILEKKVAVGDILEGLRYVKNGKVETVNGKVKQLTLQTASSKGLVDNFKNDVKLISMVLDASEQYSAKTVTVPAMEIVEDAGVENVIRMGSVMSMTFEMDLTYSNGLTQHQSLQVGDVLDNMVIMGLKPGDPDITGKFTVASFSYTASNNIITVTAVNLTDESGKTVSYDFKRFISFEEIITETVETAEDLVALLASDNKYLDLTVDQDITVEEPIVVAEGKEVVLNLGRAAITSTGDAVAIDNKGKLTITGGVFETKAVNNDGEMVLDGTNITTTAETEGGGAVINNGTLVIEDATLNVPFVGSTSDPKGPACIRNNGDLTIKKATLESASKRTYCIVSADGVITVPEGAEVVINGVHGGIAFNGGTATIEGGEFVSTEYYGLYVSNDALTADIVVNGGYFDGPNYSVWCGSDHNESVESVVRIYGGVFDHPLKDQSNVAPGAGISVYGGKFKQVVPEEYLAPGYICSELGEDEYYEVIPAPVPNEEPVEEPVVEPEVPTEEPTETPVEGE